MKLTELIEEVSVVIKPKFVKDMANNTKIDIEVDGKKVGVILTDSKEGYTVRLGAKGRGWVRTIAAAKKWADAVLNNDRGKLPPGSRWPT